MRDIDALALWIGVTAIAGPALLVMWQLLVGRINMRGLLHGRRRDGSEYFSPERVQLLIGTLAFAGTYLGELARAIPHGSLPDVAPRWLFLLGGSHAVYLGRKAYSSLGSSTPGH